MLSQTAASKKRFWALAAVTVLIAGIFIWDSKAQKSGGKALGASVSASIAVNSSGISDLSQSVIVSDDSAGKEKVFSEEKNSSSSSENKNNSGADKKKDYGSAPKKSNQSSKKKNSEEKKDNNSKDDHLSYRIIVSGGAKSIDCRGKVGKGSNVFDTLKDAGALCGFSIGYQNSSMGVFIESIGGVKNDISENKFWMFKVNGKMSDVGASSCRIKNRDVIEWDYMDTTNMF